MADMSDGLRTIADAQARHRGLLRQRKDGEASPEFEQQVRQFLDSAAALGVAIDEREDRAALQAILDYWVSVLFRLGVDVEDVLLAEFDLQLQPDLEDVDCPYTGLTAFGHGDTNNFFGRESVLAQLMDRLCAQQVVVISGRPGSGASSLVTAGIIPKVEAGALDPVAHFHVLPLTWPGTRPLEALPQQAIDGAQADASEDGMLLVVDNLDELFSYQSPEDDRLEFMRLLEAFVAAGAGVNRLVLVCRTTFREGVIDGTYTGTDWFRDVVTRCSYRLPPVSSKGLHEVILGPARRVGLRFEEGIVDDLVDDVYGELAALPLLQFSMTRLWKHREKNRITYAAYALVGGGRRALQIAGEEIWQSLDENSQRACRYIFTRLVSLGGSLAGSGDNDEPDGAPMFAHRFHSRRLTANELRQACNQPEQFDPVLQRLLDEGLLKSVVVHGDVEQQVEIAHEALFHWQRYGGWLDEIRLELRSAQRLESLAADYVSHGQLLNEETLAYAKDCRRHVGDWSLSDSVEELIHKSEEALEHQRLEKQRQIRRRVVTLAVVLGLLSLLTLRLWFKNEQLSASLEAVSLRGDVLRGNMVEIASLAETAQSAIGKGDSNAAARQVREVSLLAESARQGIELFQQEFKEQKFTELVQASLPRISIGYGKEDASRIKRDLRIKRRAMPGGVGFWGVDFSENLRQLAMARNDGTVGLLDLGADKLRPRLLTVIRQTIGASGEAEPAVVNDVAYDEYSEYLAAGGVDGQVSIWRTDMLLDEPQWICQVPGGSAVGRVYSIQVHSAEDGVWVAAGLDTDQAVIWDMYRQCKPGNPLPPERSYPAEGDVYAIDWLPERGWLAVGSEGQMVEVWSTQGRCGEYTETLDSCRVATLAGHGKAVFSVNFAPDACAPGQPDRACRLLSSSADRSLRLWDVTQSEQITTRILSGDRQLGNARYSPNGQWVAASSSGGSVMFWQLENLDAGRGPDFIAENLGGPVFGFAFLGDCQGDCEFRVVAGSFSGDVTDIELPTIDRSGQ